MVVPILIQYFSDNLVCRRKIASNHSEGGNNGWLTLTSLKAKWMIVQAVGKSKYHKKFLQPVIMGKRFSDIFQSLLVVNQSSPVVINQQRVTCLELAHVFHLPLQTSKLLSVILYRLKLLALVDYHWIQYPQHSYGKNIHLPVRFNKSIF